MTILLVLPGFVKLFHLPSLPTDPKAPEILSEFLPVSMMLLCGSEEEIMVSKKLLASPEWVPGNLAW